MSTVFETQLTWLASQEESELSGDDDGLVLAGWVAVVASWERVDAARKVAKAAHARAAHARAKYWAIMVARREGAARRIQAVARGRALRAWKVRFADIGGIALVHLLRHPDTNYSRRVVHTSRYNAARREYLRMQLFLGLTRDAAAALATALVIVAIAA